MRFWLRRWRRCPLAYVLECLGEVPTHQQAQILKAFESHRFVAVRSGHGIGKSKLMGWLVNWWLDTRGKRAPITGAGGEQLNSIVWPEVLAANRRKPGWLSAQYESTSEELRYRRNPWNWRAILRTARMDNNDALQGFHDCMFFIDEGSGVRDEIFEVASGALGDPGAFGFMTGNPTRLSGYFYRIFHGKSFWYTLHFSSADSLSEEEYSYRYVDPLGDVRTVRCHGRQTRQWVDDMAAEWGPGSNAYKIRVLGEFASLNADNLVEPKMVNRAKPEEGDGQKHGIRRLGVDPAWTGEDDTGVVIREGDRLLHAESWHGFDLVESCERVKFLFREWQCDYVHVDTIGVGAGLYDMLRHAMCGGRVGFPTVSVMASERAPMDKDAACRTLRDWMWWKCRKFFRRRPVRILMPEDEWARLRTEVLAPTYRLSQGKIVAESKDDLKKRGVRSPNIADALNLTFVGDFQTFSETYAGQSEMDRRRGIQKRKLRHGRSWKTV